MDSGFYSAFTGLAARMQSLDLVANNLANVNTVGYKGQKEFYRAYTASLQNSPLSPLNQAINDFGLLGGSRIDFSAGSLDSTGNDTDLAIDGAGFFDVKTKAGADRYTRNGNFGLNTQRQLVDSQGNLVQGQDGPVQLPNGKLTISTDGTVSVDGALVATLKVVDFAPGTQLTPEGNTDFTAPAGAAKPALAAQVREGMLESSNSNPVAGAVALIDLQRNAEMMQRALSIFNTDFNQTAVQELSRV
ncbi:MAG TPA: flagellar basal-body rod protein FlgF [Candidatus Acidoferrales bacterium]|nr:flagellar basal-body rod protein FlgF [Candidatus Acidoferrales bacterium]